MLTPLVDQSGAGPSNSEDPSKSKKPNKILNKFTTSATVLSNKMKEKVDQLNIGVSREPPPDPDLPIIAKWAKEWLDMPQDKRKDKFTAKGVRLFETVWKASKQKEKNYMASWTPNVYAYLPEERKELPQDLIQEKYWKLEGIEPHNLPPNVIALQKDALVWINNPDGSGMDEYSTKYFDLDLDRCNDDATCFKYNWSTKILVRRFKSGESFNILTQYVHTMPEQ